MVSLLGAVHVGLRYLPIVNPLFRGDIQESIGSTHCDNLVDHSRGIVDRPQHSESRGGAGECGGSLPIPGPLMESAFLFVSAARRAAMRAFLNRYRKRTGGWRAVGLALALGGILVSFVFVLG